MRSRRNHALLRCLAASLAAGAAALAAFGLSAQQPASPPEQQPLAVRLNDQRTLFLATVSDEKRVTGQDLEAGRLVAAGGSKQGGAGMACISCHGAEGAGEGAAAFPRLASMSAWYMYKQLNDYASGSRPNEVMTQIAQQLTDEERQSVASYYAVVQAPYPPVPEAENARDLQWGGQLAAAGNAQKGIPACTNCHGGEGLGVAPSVPYIAGQHAEYVALQLQLWKDGVRKNDPFNVMRSIAVKMAPEDMRAVAQYYARVRPLEPAAPARPAGNPSQ